MTGIWPGSPSRRWGIELTEGQPDTSANKANEKEVPNYEETDRRRPRCRPLPAHCCRAAPAQADAFLSCGYGAGIASSVTTCEFAANVRYAWFHQPGPVVEAYSPVTGQVYTMQCGPGSLAHSTGEVCSRFGAWAVTTPWW